MKNFPLAFVIVASLGLTACNSGGDNAPSAQQPSASAAGQNTAAAMNTPLQASQVKVAMLLQEAPQFRADGEALVVTVEIRNEGSATLSSTGTHPVHLGAHAADISGKVTLVDLARADIPVLPSGGQAVVEIFIPVGQSLGKQIQILPVQEGVNWFDGFGVKPLVSARSPRAIPLAKPLFAAATGNLWGSPLCNRDACATLIPGTSAMLNTW